MRKLITLAVACVLALAVVPSAQQPDALKAAADSLGAAKINTLQFQVRAQLLGRTEFLPDRAVAARHREGYTASINYNTASMRQELVREMGTVMPRGGGGPFTGDSARSWSSAEATRGSMPAAPPGAAAPPAAPAPAAAVERMLALWATPQGFVKPR
jgi:hypothetical protein